jgi:hypothetical protein
MRNLYQEIKYGHAYALLCSAKEWRDISLKYEGDGEIHPYCRARMRAEAKKFIEFGGNKMLAGLKQLEKRHHD